MLSGARASRRGACPGPGPAEGSLAALHSVTWALCLPLTTPTSGCQQRRPDKAWWRHRASPAPSRGRRPGRELWVPVSRDRTGEGVGSACGFSEKQQEDKLLLEKRPLLPARPTEDTPCFLVLTVELGNSFQKSKKQQGKNLGST